MTRQDGPSRAVFAWNVWRLRTGSGLTQAELGGKIGWRSAGARVSRIEMDEKPPTLDTVDAVAAALGVTAAELLTPHAGDGTPPHLASNGARP